MTAKILVGILIFLAAEIQVLLAIHFVVRFAVSRGVELQGTLIVSLTRRLQITLLASYIFGAIAILMVCQAVNTSWVWNGL